MFQLSPQDIHLGAAADGKQEAIRQVAAALTEAGCVSAGYVDGMLQRELQTSTYLGNGIAIPHGTTDTRDLVLKTGVQVFQFPQGIAWAKARPPMWRSVSPPAPTSIWRCCASSRTC